VVGCDVYRIYVAFNIRSIQREQGPHHLMMASSDVRETVAEYIKTKTV
jgi:hypothetical protein